MYIQFAFIYIYNNIGFLSVINQSWHRVIRCYEDLPLHIYPMGGEQSLWLMIGNSQCHMGI